MGITAVIGRHVINEIIDDSQPVKTLGSDKLLKDALYLMSLSNIKVIPITTVRGKVLGVLTHSSVIRVLGYVLEKKENKGRAASAVLDFPVSDFVERPCYCTIHDTIDSVFPKLQQNEFLIVGSPDGIDGIISYSDLAEYYKRTSTPFLIMAQIEMAIRELINISVTPDKLDKIIRHLIPRKSENRDPSNLVTLEEVAFSDYKTIVCSEGTFEKHFSQSFGAYSPMVRSKLEELRALRNDIFHLKRRIEQSDLATLESHAEWLRMRIDIASDAKAVA